jgi:hypothetical protein
LLFVVDALNAAGLFFALGESREQHARENGYDSNDNQQFDQREGGQTFARDIDFSLAHTYALTTTPALAHLTFTGAMIQFAGVDTGLLCGNAAGAWFISQSYHRSHPQQYPVLGATSKSEANFT